MITILFWNIHKNSRAFDHLACLRLGHPIDVFLLAESPKNLKPAIRSLNAAVSDTYREEANARAKVRAITRLPQSDFAHIYTSLGREMAIWSLSAPKLSAKEVLIAGVHLMSKAGGSTSSGQALAAGEVIRELAEFEDDRKHRNTTMVGDFNMHPYDPGMTSAASIHAQMTRELARRPDRRYRSSPRRRFYNPMWGLFGDRTAGPAGTHYWRSSTAENPMWGMLDQVLLREPLMQSMNNLDILDHDGIHSLLSADGAPDRMHLSDHLPLLFQLDV